MKKSYFSLFLLIFSNLFLYSQTINDTEIIIPGHVVYSQIKALQAETQTLFFTQNTPISVGEMKFYLNKIDEDSLTENGHKLYEKIENYLYGNKNLLNIDYVQAYTGLKLNLEGYYKTNNDIPWTNNYFYKDNLLTVPIEFGFGNLISIQSNLFFGKNYIAMQNADNFTNIPLKVRDFEFFFPTYAYGSTGHSYENWGWNFHIGKQGKTIGDTLTGSVLYNSTFESDCYAELSLYSDVLKYSLDVVQLSSNRMDSIQGDATERYLYSHQYDIRLFKKSKISLYEGSMIVNPFSLRFLNPLVIMHQYGGWTDYETTENYNIYKETNFCAYFAGMFETIPVANLRLYGIYSQIEMQLPWEKSQKRGRYYPNSFALQIGSEYNLNTNNAGSFIFALEGVYTSPYMYMKQTPSASLYRFRTDMQTKGTVYSWVGSPFGPDTLAGQLKVEYKPDLRQTYEFDYLLSAKGTHDFSTFDQKYNDIYSYYPSVVWYLVNNAGYEKNLDDLGNEVDSYSLTGIPAITNQFSLQGNYKISDSMSISLKFVFSYIINYENVLNNNQKGFESSLAFSYSIF